MFENINDKSIFLFLFSILILFVGCDSKKDNVAPTVKPQEQASFTAEKGGVQIKYPFIQATTSFGPGNNSIL